jgi:ABC-2 type transport system permease protein
MTTHSLNILPIIRKEFRQVRRDKRVLGVLLFIPALMLVMFGYAVNFDVKHTRLAVYDQDRTRTSRGFAEQFVNTEYFDFHGFITTAGEADDLLDNGLVRVVVVIPSDFTRNLALGRETDVQILVDGSNASAAATSLGYVRAIVQEYTVGVIKTALLKRGGAEAKMPVEVQPRIWYNPELRSARFLLPGLIAFIMMVTAVISTALSVVREREHGTMEQIMVSPVKPVELILGKTVPYLVISTIATLVILLVGYLVFGVANQGSYLLLALVALIFLVGGLGFGLLISTIADTQQVAFMMAVVITMLPTFILSGFVFPITNMPWIIQVITYLVPARYFLEALRGIMLKGTGLGAYWEQVVALVLYAGLMIAVSSRRMGMLMRKLK